MKAAVLSALLLSIGQSQDQCVYTANDKKYTFNLTQISKRTLEYEGRDSFYYYTPCRNGLRCTQGGALYSANAAQYKPGENTCEHWLSVDHHEQAEYSFIGGSWRFTYDDGQLCDQTQEPRRTSVYYHCNNVNNDNLALLETAEEPSTCNYYYSIASTLACMPQNNHNSECQWKVPVEDGKFEYLDLSSIKGEVLRADWKNGYEFYYSVCSNNLHCYQQGQQQVMSVVDNTATGTCEHSLAVWEDGQVQPLLHQNEDETHWTFHYWNGQTCSNGQQGEQKIRFFCDDKQDEPKVIGVYTEGNCIFDMNISTKAACLDQEPRWVDAKQWMD